MSRPLALILAVASANAAVLEAQEPVRPVTPALSTAEAHPTATTLERRDLRPRAVIRTAPATISGAPRDFRVITIAVPESAPRDRDLDFETESAEDTPLLGNTSGIIRAGVERARPIRLTVGIPARARAGTTRIALVRFITREPKGIDPLVIEVPVQLLVHPVQRVELNMLQPSASARPGQRLQVPIRIFNAGNAGDDVTLRFDAPAGWHAELPATEASVALPVHGFVDRTVQIRVPLLANGGSWTVRVLAMRGSDVAAEQPIAVTVMNNAMQSATGGARVTLGSATAGGPWDGLSSAYSLGIDGQLSDDIMVSGRAVHSVQPTQESGIGLGRTGYLTGPPSLSMSSADWRFSAGPQGVSFSDLAGVNGAVVGLSGGAASNGWSSSALAGRPIAGSTGQGLVAGGQLSRPVGRASVAFTATHLDERTSSAFSGRALDAASVSSSMPIGPSIVAQNELALRHTPAGLGVGVASSIVQRTTRGSFELRYLNAPGGSASFARAASEIAGSVARQLGDRVGASAAAWKSSDNNASFAGIETRGATLNSVLSLPGSASFTVEARHYRVRASAAPLRFGNEENALTTRLGWSHGFIHVGGSATRSAMMRSTGLSDGLSITDRAPHSAVQAELTVTTSRGVLRVEGGNESNGAGIGLPEQRRQFGGEVDRVALATASFARVWGSGEFQRIDLGSQYGIVDLMRAGLRVETRSGFNAVFDMERNPFYAQAFATGGSTMWSVKLEQPFQLRRFGSNAARGVAYRDVNGNGRRDLDEPTLGGMAVRQGSETTVTDEQGRFRFSNPQSGVPSLDPRTLPVGSVEGTVAQHAKHEYDLAVTSLAPVSVQLHVVGADSVRVPASSLAAAVLVARDAAGVAWVARALSGGQMLFDGLPSGRYTLSLDLSEIPEPLRTEAELPVLTVESGNVPTDMRIGLRARAMRIRASSQKNAGAPNGAGSTPPDSRSRREPKK